MAERLESWGKVQSGDAGEEAEEEELWVSGHKHFLCSLNRKCILLNI